MLLCVKFCAQHQKKIIKCLNVCKMFNGDVFMKTIRLNIFFVWRLNIKVFSSIRNKEVLFKRFIRFFWKMMVKSKFWLNVNTINWICSLFLIWDILFPTHFANNLHWANPCTSRGRISLPDLVCLTNFLYLAGDSRTWSGRPQMAKYP